YIQHLNTNGSPMWTSKSFDTGFFPSSVQMADGSNNDLYFTYLNFSGNVWHLIRLDGSGKVYFDLQQKFDAFTPDGTNGVFVYGGSKVEKLAINGSLIASLNITPFANTTTGAFGIFAPYF